MLRMNLGFKFVSSFTAIIYIAAFLKMNARCFTERLYCIKTDIKKY